MNRADFLNQPPARVRVYEPKKRNKGWRVRWVIDGTTHRQATFQTRALADRYRRDLLTALERGLDPREIQ